MAGTCECGNEPSGSIKCEEFLDWPKNGQLLNKESVAGIKYKYKISGFHTKGWAVCYCQGPDVKNRTNTTTVFEYLIYDVTLNKFIT